MSENSLSRLMLYSRAGKSVVDQYLKKNFLEEFQKERQEQTLVKIFIDDLEKEKKEDN